MSFVYCGLKANLERRTVTEEEIQQQMERTRQQYPRVEVVKDRAACQGDEVLLDYAGFCNGEQFQGGTAEKQTLVLGSGMFIPGFEEQLIGRECGEEVTVQVTFPQQYHAENLAGKEAEFRCKIHEIRKKSLYEMDDTFAKEVGGCETLEEMKKKMGESLQKFADEQSEMDLQDLLIRQAAETLELEITPEQLEKAVDEQMENLALQLKQQGLSVELYCSLTNTSQEQLRKDAQTEARNAIRLKATVEKIAQLEELKAEQQEIAVAVATICRQNNMTLEQLKPYYDAEFEAAVVRTVLMSKAMRLVRDAAQVTEIQK